MHSFQKFFMDIESWYDMSDERAFFGEFIQAQMFSKQI